MRKNLVRFLMAGLLGVSLTSVGSAQAQDEPFDEPDDMGDPMVDPVGDDDDGAVADPAAGEGADVAAAPGEDIKPPLITPKSAISVNVPLLINLSADNVGKPVALTPDIWYGVGPKLEAGLAHSPQALSGFFSQAGLVGSTPGLCITGEENGCAKVYGNPALLARFHFMEGNLDLAADGGLMFLNLTELTVAIKAGVLGRFTSGKITVWFNPNLWLGLTDRDADLMTLTPGNKEKLNVPVGATFAVNPKLMVGAQTGISGYLDGFGDAHFIPITLGGMYMVSDTLGAGAFFTFDNIAGSNSSADFRSLQLAVHYMVPGS